MVVEVTPVPLHALHREHGLTRVWRWRTGTGGGWSEAHVTVGWLPDGRWFVEDTRVPHVWLFTGPPRETRDAALEFGEGRMGDGEWEPAIATYEPGVMPARAAQVPEWPPGHGPS